MSLQIRERPAHLGGGWIVTGKDPQGRGVKVHAKQRATAEHLRDVIAAGGETQASDWALDNNAAVIAEGTLVEAPKREPGEWVCPVHGGGHWIPAGISKKSGKPYAAFRACDAKLPDGTWCKEAAPFRRPAKAPTTVPQQVTGTIQPQSVSTPIQQATQALAQAARQAECRAFQPQEPVTVWGPSMGHCTSCGNDLNPHPSPIESRVSKARGGRGAGLTAERTVFTVTHVEAAHGESTTLAIGWEAGKPGIPSVMVMDETAGAAIRSLLTDPMWEGGKVNAWADKADVLVSDRTLDEDVIRTLDNAIVPAVYLGDNAGIPGMKPTLIYKQGVVILRTYQGTVPGDPLVQCDVLYDPTDPRAGECQWRQRSLITGVSRRDLSPSNWRGPIPPAPNADPNDPGQRVPDWQGPKDDNRKGPIDPSMPTDADQERAGIESVADRI